MKIKLTFCLLLICQLAFSQTTRTGKGITFKVSDVAVATDHLPEVNYRNALESRLLFDIEGFPQSYKNQKLVRADAHPFVETLHLCFAQHRPLVLSPDMIWLLICQGVAEHINLNPEKFRQQLVNHQGKKKITIRRDDFKKGSSSNNWESVIPEFCDSVKTYASPDFARVMLPTFSTTGLNEKLAFEVSYLNSLKNFFELNEISTCGIPEITLEGTVADWKLIRKQIEELRQYDLDFWVNELIPILDEFVAASEGHSNQKFWQSIYRWSGICGGPYITGWAIKFFPYINKAQNQTALGRSFIYHGIEVDSLPEGYKCAEFNWKYFSQKYPMLVIGGFLAISQDSTTKALRPLITWAVAEQKRIKNNENCIITNSKKNSNIFSEVGTQNINYETADIDYLLMFQNPIDEEFNFAKDYILPIFFPSKCPDYKSGVVEMEKFVLKKLRGENLKGKVVIKFVVTWLGTIENFEIISTTDTVFTKAVIKALQSIDDIKPAMAFEKLVNVQMKYTFEVK
jgi:predicted Zn-ribbon and HTH transcriptional regulator